VCGNGLQCVVMDCSGWSLIAAWPEIQLQERAASGMTSDLCGYIAV
jgi:hypothetical protein